MSRDMLRARSMVRYMDRIMLHLQLGASSDVMATMRLRVSFMVMGGTHQC